MFKANSLDQDVAAVDASFRNIGYATGFVYDRWRTGINCMLMKKANSHWVDKLRTILLLEVDSGMNYKKIYRDVMWVAELAQAIPPELGGGRRNHRPIELVLNFVLLNDAVRQKRKAIGIGSTDFLGCFDRLVHIIALLCLRLFGMPHAPVQSMIEAIQAMTHLIRTAFGDSTEGYKSNPTRNPPTGLLQGNAAAMAGNTVAVSVIVKMMKSKGFGLNMWSALTYEAIKLICSNFVDDTKLFQGGPNNYTSGRDVYRQMQPMLDYWEATLRATGGAFGS